MCARITVFTPTYNRRELLTGLYQSLIKQINKNFIWLIVDDGSTDDTREHVEKWIKENKIHIEYVYQSNSGKMRAHNTAVKYCKTEFLLDIDSDDKAHPDCIEFLYSNLSLIESEEACGVMCFYKEVGKDTNTSVFKKWNDTFVTLSQINNSGYKGETTLLFKTEVLKKFPFPEIDGEKFIPEGYIYSQIDKKYKYLCKNKNIVYGNYQADGYSQNSIKLYVNNPYSFSLIYLQKYKDSKKLSPLIRYMAFRIMSHKSIEFRNNKLPWYSLILYTVSFILQLKWKLRYKRVTDNSRNMVH